MIILNELVLVYPSEIFAVTVSVYVPITSELLEHVKVLKLVLIVKG